MMGYEVKFKVIFKVSGTFFKNKKLQYMPDVTLRKFFYFMDSRYA